MFIKQFVYLKNIIVNDVIYHNRNKAGIAYTFIAQYDFRK